MWQYQQKTRAKYFDIAQRDSRAGNLRVIMRDAISARNLRVLGIALAMKMEWQS